MRARPYSTATNLALLAATVALSGIPAISTAAIPLADDDEGMTCYFYAATGRLEWSRPGGDWVDVRGKRHGEDAYTQTGVSRSAGIQAVKFDVTSLTRDWNKVRTPGAILLRAPGGKTAGPVNFRSRESPDSESHPFLDLEWDDGQNLRSAPLADTYFACPTHKNLGRREFFQIGGNYAAALVFPFEMRPGRQITRATLVLTTDKQYGSGATIGVYRLDPPSGNSEVEPGLAAAYRFDSGIEANPDVIFSERFEKPGWRSEWSDIDPNGSAEPVVTDAPDNRFAAFDGKALKVTVQAGKRQGLNMHLKLARRTGGEPDEAYFRYYLRFAENWNPTITGGKMPGFAGTYDKAGWGGRKSDGTNGWSARGAFFQQSAKKSTFSGLRGIGSYIYHPDAKTAYGDPIGWNLGPTGMLVKNRWYSIEQYVKLNRPDASDGILRAWIDGKLAYELTGLRFRDIPDLKIESVWMNVYHGGIAKAKADLSLYIDNIVIARKYIGPTGSAN